MRDNCLALHTRRWQYRCSRSCCRGHRGAHAVGDHVAQWFASLSTTFTLAKLHENSRHTNTHLKYSSFCSLHQKRISRSNRRSGLNVTLAEHDKVCLDYTFAEHDWACFQNLQHTFSEFFDFQIFTFSLSRQITTNVSV